MNFQCEELRISDNELGCTITFSDSKTPDNQFKAIEELMNAEDKYLLIQRTYPEDDESDYYYLETSETDIDFDYNDIIVVALTQDRFKIQCSGAHLEIGLKLTESELKDLEEILESRFKDRIRLKR